MSEGTPVCDPLTVIAVVAIGAMVIYWIKVTKPTAENMVIVATAAFGAIIAVVKCMAATPD